MRFGNLQEHPHASIIRIWSPLKSSSSGFMHDSTLIIYQQRWLNLRSKQLPLLDWLLNSRKPGSSVLIVTEWLLLPENRTQKGDPSNLQKESIVLLRFDGEERLKID
jgi:hypothetical protein